MSLKVKSVSRFRVVKKALVISVQVLLGLPLFLYLINKANNIWEPGIKVFDSPVKSLTWVHFYPFFFFAVLYTIVYFISRGKSEVDSNDDDSSKPVKLVRLDQKSVYYLYLTADDLQNLINKTDYYTSSLDVRYELGKDNDRASLSISKNEANQSFIHFSEESNVTFIQVNLNTNKDLKKLNKAFRETNLQIGLVRITNSQSEAELVLVPIDVDKKIKYFPPISHLTLYPILGSLGMTAICYGISFLLKMVF